MILASMAARGGSFDVIERVDVRPFEVEVVLQRFVLREPHVMHNKHKDATPCHRDETEEEEQPLPLGLLPG